MRHANVRHIRTNVRQLVAQPSSTRQSIYLLADAWVATSLILDLVLEESSIALLWSAQIQDAVEKDKTQDTAETCKALSGGAYATDKTESRENRDGA